MSDGKADSPKRNAATWFAVAKFHPQRLKFSESETAEFANVRA